MRLAKKVSQAESINYNEYWIPLDPTKIVMMKLDAKQDLKEYHPTHKEFDSETVRRFVSRGKMKFHARRAYWRHFKGDLIIVAGTFVNEHLSGLSDMEIINLRIAMDSYNAVIRSDVDNNKYGVGVRMMSFAEVMAA
jgi:hypothetical protein